MSRSVVDMWNEIHLTEQNVCNVDTLSDILRFNFLPNEMFPNAATIKPNRLYLFVMSHEKIREVEFVLWQNSR